MTGRDATRPDATQGGTQYGGRPRIRLFLRLLAVLLLLACVPGCPDTRGQRELRGSGMDMFAPETMRIHPLTRLIKKDPTGQLEVRLEFLDQMGDVGKAVATIYFELFNYEASATGHRGERISLWNADISAPQQNKAHWDGITRTYLFRLDLPDAKLLAPGRKAVLVATVVFPNSTRLHDEVTLTAR